MGTDGRRGPGPGLGPRSLARASPAITARLAVDAWGARQLCWRRTIHSRLLVGCGNSSQGSRVSEIAVSEHLEGRGTAPDLEDEREAKVDQTVAFDQLSRRVWK